MTIDMNLRTFAGTAEEWLDEDLQNTCFGRILRQKLGSITFKLGDIKIMFLDSLKFIRGSFANLFETQRKNSELDLPEGFKNMTMHHPKIRGMNDSMTLQRLHLLLNKIRFP